MKLEDVGYGSWAGPSIRLYIYKIMWKEVGRWLSMRREIVLC